MRTGSHGGRPVRGDVGEDWEGEDPAQFMSPGPGAEIGGGDAHADRLQQCDDDGFTDSRSTLLTTDLHVLAGAVVVRRANSDALCRVVPMPFFAGSANTATMMMATRTSPPITHSQTQIPLSWTNDGTRRYARDNR